MTIFKSAFGVCLSRTARLETLYFAFALGCVAGDAIAAIPSASAIEAKVESAMQATQSRGMAVAVIERGQVRYVKSFGVRNAKGHPLEQDTIMYGASLTKLAFSYMVMQLVAEQKLQLDQPLATYLAQPLPSYPSEDRYAPWSDLKTDPRWRQISALTTLTHSTGFNNFAFLEPDGKLRIHFVPNSRYAYSGEGFILLQFVLERGLGLEIGAEMQTRVFDRFQMRNTSMTWRPAFAKNLADGWRMDGSIEPHDERSKARAAGSMDTTISDMARFAAGYIRAEGIAKSRRDELFKPRLLIKSATQFPSLLPEPAQPAHKNLRAGPGMVVFEGPQGRGVMKGGHNDSTGNMLVCLHLRQRCVVILANDVRAEAAFPGLIDFILGESGAPWRWEYGAMAFWAAEQDRVY